MTETNSNYNLIERTGNFGENIIVFCKSVKQDNINRSIINQLVRSGTSVGANYCEANNASSKKDFKNKIGLEIKETLIKNYQKSLEKLADFAKLQDSCLIGRNSLPSFDDYIWGGEIY